MTIASDFFLLTGSLALVSYLCIRSKFSIKDFAQTMSVSVAPYKDTADFQKTLAEVAFLAIAADGEITDDEWRAFGEELGAQGSPVRRDEIRAQFEQARIQLRDRAVLEREVRARAQKLGPDGCLVAMNIVRTLAQRGASFATESVDYRRAVAHDSRALLDAFEQWLGVREALARPK